MIKFHFISKMFKKVKNEFCLEKTYIRAYDIKEVKEFYESYTEEKIDKIHDAGKITPLEKVYEWESHGLCAPGDAIGSAGGRCRTFLNCHECLLAYASRNEEYNKINLKMVNNDIINEDIKVFVR